MIEFDIQEELKKLPKKPGVYIMHDKHDTIIYVGKAVNLFNRVRSYFRENIGRGPKIDKMVSLIVRFEYIVTDSELEALVLENNLIKEHRPKYNTMLMDDKTYPYIKVTMGERYPRLLMVRQMKKDKSRYFGPYTSGQAVRDVIELINKVCLLRTCNKALEEVSPENPKDRYCLNYHICQCCGPCQGKVSAEEYAERVSKALDFLNGNFGEIIRDLKSKMSELSEALEFEEAAKYRDLLKSVQAIAEKQKIEDASLDDKDIIGIAEDESDTVVQVFFVRAGRMVGREHFHMSEGEAGSGEEGNHTISEFIKQFYSGTPWIPHEIMVPQEPEDREIIEQWLTDKKGSRVYIRTPKIGQKEKLVELASKNARILLDQDKEKIKREELRTIGAVKEIEEWLGLVGIRRMEAFDISNTSGFENVASMVVFEDGKPRKSDYRKFKIKSVTGPDDYACMKEALTRRFTHGLEEMKDNSAKKSSFVKFPDLLLMDGGRGQVNIALEVLNELGIDLPVAGMVKDDNHRTRGVYYNNIEIPVDTHSEGFKLVTRVQDEAHRFAIEYHRSLRTRDQVHSVLDDIPGVGPSRRRALMKAFTSIEEIREAGVEELMDKAALPSNAAQAIYDFFHSS